MPEPSMKLPFHLAESVDDQNEDEQGEDTTDDLAWDYGDSLRERLRLSFGRLLYCVLLRRHKTFTYTSTVGKKFRGCYFCPFSEKVK